MIEISTLDDVAALSESFEVECKLAAGRDGNGACPKSIWETYSAFANTHGGDIFLGLKETKDGKFELIDGIKNIQKVQDELWTNLNDPTLVSVNILSDRHVRCITIDAKNILHVHVPKATRKQKPVYIKGNPLTGTYKRFNSADIRQSDETVRRMLAEQQSDDLDNSVLKGYDLDDVDLGSLAAYRQRYANLQPDHPWNKEDNLAFLRLVGAYARDRETNHTGLTKGGLLMFGKSQAIKQAFPNYFLDYQERPEARKEARWVDRITLDGTWAGNIFEFYQLVTQKLVADLKIPFELKGDERQAETSVHTVLREALVNTLIHADYSGRASVLVVKRPDMFGFRNPGHMRVPIEIALRGGESDCRNRVVQDLFRFIGLGENAGSGLPKILDGWTQQHWRKPLLQEKDSPSDQTLLELHMLSLLPEKSINQLKEIIHPNAFNRLTDNERLILVTALIEKTVDHQRMMSIIDIHPRDLSTLFSGLVDKALLIREGSGRGSVYCLHQERQMETMRESTVTSPGSPSTDEMDRLRAIAEPVSSKKRVAKEIVETTILALCTHYPCSKDMLSKLLNRSLDTLTKDYLQPLIKARKIFYQYPTQPNHPKQTYSTRETQDA